MKRNLSVRLLPKGHAEDKLEKIWKDTGSLCRNMPLINPRYLLCFIKAAYLKANYPAVYGRGTQIIYE
jgi:hypothetical protein